MLTRSLLAALLLLGNAAAGLAQVTVDYAANPFGDRDVVDASLTVVPDGNQVQIGYFEPTLDLAANAGNLLTLEANWHPFDSTTISTIFGQPGKFAGSGTGFDPSFNNKQISLWIFKTTDNAAPTANFSNVQQYGLFSSSLANWKFPVQGTIPPANSTSILAGQADVAYWGSILGDATTGHLELGAVVPEPRQAALVVGLALMVSVVWQRRQSFQRS
jgi:hypothetical protein